MKIEVRDYDVSASLYFSANRMPYDIVENDTKIVANDSAWYLFEREKEFLFLQYGHSVKYLEFCVKGHRDYLYDAFNFDCVPPNRKHWEDIYNGYKTYREEDIVKLKKMLKLAKDFSKGVIDVYGRPIKQEHPVAPEQVIEF